MRMAIRPHKQTVIIFVICVIAVGLTTIYANGSSPQQPKITSAEDIVSINSGLNKIIASSSNDWQKQFINTSATNSSFKVPKNSKSDSTKPEVLTATDRFARDFFLKYMQLHKAGQDSDQTAVSEASDQVITNHVSDIQLPRTYSIYDLKVSTDSDDATMKDYSRSIVTILTAYMPSADNNEAVITINALDKGDMTILKQIDPIIANYKSAVSALLKVTVPKPVANYHVQLINGVGIALFNAQALRTTDVDPIRGMDAVGLEMTGLETMDTALTNIKQYFSDRALPFTT